MKSKKNIKSIVILALLSIIALFFINISFAANTAKVNVETANLREKADSNSKILMLLPIDEEVEIIEQEGNWCNVKESGVTRYLREDLLTKQGEVETQTETKEPETAGNNESEEIQGTVIPEENKEQENNTSKKQVKENTKLKIIPSINATDVIEIKEGEEVTIVETINGWVCIETGLTRGWLREEKLAKIEEEISQGQEPEATENPEEPEQEPAQEVVAEPEKIQKTLYVNTELVNMRKEASTTSEVLARLALNTAVDVYKEDNGWYKVKVNGKDGYISSSLLSETKQEVVTSRGTEEPRNNNNNEANTATVAVTTSTVGSTVVQTANNYIGCKYVYGGSSPSGFDCSGFTSYVFKQHGITLSRTAAGQYSNGVAVDRSSLQPGDLVMFGPSVSGINHVGIYIGGGQIVHAANSSRGVTTDTINSGYYNNNYVGARRVN